MKGGGGVRKTVVSYPTLKDTRTTSRHYRPISVGVTECVRVCQSEFVCMCVCAWNIAYYNNRPICHKISTVII